MRNKLQQEKKPYEIDSMQNKINNSFLEYDYCDYDDLFNIENDELDEWRVIKKHTKFYDGNH
jgi:hypothetical protein